MKINRENFFAYGTRNDRGGVVHLLKRNYSNLLLKTDCIEIDDEKLSAHFTSSFGIFAGRPEEEAVFISPMNLHDGWPKNNGVPIKKGSGWQIGLLNCACRMPIKENW